MAVTTDNNSPGTGAERLARVLEELQPEAQPDGTASARRAIALARLLQQRAVPLQTPQERRQQRELERMMLSPHDKATLIQLTDEGMRSRRASRAADQLIHILDVQGVPRFFSALDQALLKGFQSFGGYLPGVAVPLVREKMREETANVILPAEAEYLLAHLRARHAAGLRMNLNLLGEALLGERAAAERFETYLEALQHPEIECISVKISTIYSQISPLAWEDTLAVLCERLERLYLKAQQHRFLRSDGTEVHKFVYLDMEEYRDMTITAEAFMCTLERPGLAEVSAGIALQAYLPDAYATQKRINTWARERVASGGAPVTIRLVKGANLAMERVDAALHGWPQAPFTSKLEVDANYKRMLHEGLRPENIAAVRLGIASHNLFELAYGLVAAHEAAALDRVQFEMLEGMANHQRRALSDLTDGLLLYAPAARREQFVQAIGYLVRRLDENTGPDNFLSHAFKLEVDSEDWRRLAGQFLSAFEHIEGLSEQPRRTQDRRRPAERTASQDPGMRGFRNEPDTDFSLPQNIQWAKEIIARWEPRYGDDAQQIPLVIAGESILAGRELRECRDPSRPGFVVGRYREANQADLARAVDCARSDPTHWGALAPERRAAILGEVALRIAQRRGELLGAAMADGGKIFPESDPEVSEAIDFVELYRRCALYFQGLETVSARPRGVVAVIPPWNFPIAIPCGGVAAALATGNRVILKPASDSVLVAYELCRCFWDAGVPREVLQFMPCAGGSVGAQLAAHSGVDAVILTGGTQTARSMLSARPSITLLAETGGKDATIVTAMADRDQAIKNVLHSAFSHSGQKCSATSLLILEEEVYEDAAFKTALCDAVSSLPVGSAWSRRTRVGPLIRRPSGELERGITQLEPGESWAVEPRPAPDNPQLWSPGVKWGVQPGSFTHMTELFGPVLAVMKAADLLEAIDLVNQTGYGLTSGLESLDQREQKTWVDGIRAGNLYVNRVTTGAIVLRQPFGGMGKSVFGPGIKAGGPNYVAQLMDFEDRCAGTTAPAPDDPLLMDLSSRLAQSRERHPGLSGEEVDAVLMAIASYARNMAEEFAREHDHFRLLGQDNIRRYLPVSELRVRVHPDDSGFALLARVAAARTAGCRITVSVSPASDVPGLSWLEQATEDWGAAIEFVEESDEALAQAIIAGQTERVRYAAPDRVPSTIFEAAWHSGLYLARAPVLQEGRIELLWYVREQAISNSYHRYGNLGERGEGGRATVS
ncbi:MAG: bifunctional proline dehydrogenase/L-glutamate gamma-semialdehyde dehydrogenase [Gammaproteobacteria bacterium]|jgi:RHH-type proline utilization regulon transcriptional repressor/proline dehydrogenase/delta 1-pyrroline-5-carboxylate dehydrogenase